MRRKRRICFVTGTRAEFGLMCSTLSAIQSHPQLQLQILVTGMHLDPSRGRTIDAIRRDGWPVSARVPWRASNDSAGLAASTGLASAGIARAFSKLDPDIVLVVGDRVEAFAAAAAAHLSHRALAHVHGGDRAAGQVDDALRHCISKLAHIHFPATANSAQRLVRMGENRRRIFRVGSPGNDDLHATAASSSQVVETFPAISPQRFALVVYHPASANAAREQRTALAIANSLVAAGIPQIVIVQPNNDPGAQGICRAWRRVSCDSRFIIRADIARPLFLGLMRDAAMLVGNSSSGIIEAAGFRTPVIDIGPRQAGRERSKSVRHVDEEPAAIDAAIRSIWNSGQPRRAAAGNVYGRGGAGKKIARHLAEIELSASLLRKLIAY